MAHSDHANRAYLKSAQAAVGLQKPSFRIVQAVPMLVVLQLRISLLNLLMAEESIRQVVGGQTRGAFRNFMAVDRSNKNQSCFPEQWILGTAASVLDSPHLPV